MLEMCVVVVRYLLCECSLKYISFCVVYNGKLFVFLVVREVIVFNREKISEEV